MQRMLQEIYNANKTTCLAEIRRLRVFILLLFFLAKLIVAKLGQTSNKVKEMMQVLLNLV